ncbi:2-phospho-L-lactate transferase [Rhodoligotrophos appendicifer]|uniref:2-phospho-L-lactate transferase n=1 Tax=Rhodoligotrophos appendicifer TaxID=987056 RepID=UPI001FE976A4|nr:2-phospho-L-lactate transferase [Rhodoligotrophos appendicifer]
MVALSGGVGGSKLVTGLASLIAGDDLLVVANTGDDFKHLGLHVSPDIDTLIYASTGRSNPVTGWGQANETWSFMDMLGTLGGPVWFNLGDRDLALHVWRTHRLNEGASLTEVTDEIARRCSVPFRLIPMTNDEVTTVVETEVGALPMQNYFVERRCVPRVKGLRYEGAAAARPNSELLAALADPALELIVICPSNPFLSIDPILAVPTLRAAIESSPAPVVGVTPIIGGQAVKGPTAKMMGELGLKVDAATVAERYGSLLDAYLLEDADHALAERVRNAGIQPVLAQTLMSDMDAKIGLAKAVLEAGQALLARSSGRSSP